MIPGPLPKIHPRTFVVDEARLELATALHEICKRHELTVGEALQVVNEVLGGHVASVARASIRAERRTTEDPSGSD